MGIRRRIERKVNAALGHSHTVMNQGQAAISQTQATLQKASLALDEIIDLLDEIEEGGLRISLEIAGRDVPIVLKIRPNSTDEEAHG